VTPDKGPKKVCKHQPEDIRRLARLLFSCNYFQITSNSLDVDFLHLKKKLPTLPQGVNNPPGMRLKGLDQKAKDEHQKTDESEPESRDGQYGESASSASRPSKPRTTATQKVIILGV